MPQHPTRAPLARRVRATGVRATAILGTALLLTAAATPLATPSPAEAAVSDTHLVFGPAADAELHELVYAGDNTSTVPGNFVLDIENWNEVHYRVVGATGARAEGGTDGNNGARGGAGSAISGTVPDDATRLSFGWGVRGGAGAGTQSGGFSAGTEASRGGDGGERDAFTFTGGGGGGASQLTAYRAGSDAPVLRVIAAGGGGAGGGYDHPLCPGAQGGGGDAPGYDSPEAVTGLPGSQVMHCASAAGGRSGLAFLEVPAADVHRTGRSATFAPGSGGGGGGIRPGEAGEVLEGQKITVSASDGGAGGGGGGASSVIGETVFTRVLAGEDERGDGRVVLSYYLDHLVNLTSAQPVPGTTVSSERPIPFVFQLTAPENTSRDALDQDGVITATIDGAPVNTPAGGRATGTLEGGISLTLPPSGATPHELCFSYQPSSEKLYTDQPLCIDLAVTRTVLETQLALGASFVRGDWIDGAINPLCGLDCALVPVLTPGPLLHPRILTDGLSPDGSLSLPTTLTLHWIDKTDAASGTQTRDVARATQGFTPIGFPPNYVALVDGAVPYTYLTFRPHGAPPLVGHVYEISATWTDAGMLAFAESPPVTVKFVPNPTTTTAAWDDASLPVGSVPTLRASAHGSYGAHLPTCCDNFPDSPGPTAVTGTYTATLTSGNDGIAMRSTVGASVSWDDWPVLPVGTYSVLVAVESSNPNWRDSFVTLPLTITRTPSAASIGVSPSAAPWDTPRQIAANLTAPGSLIAETPTGEVQFSLERIGGWAPLGAAVLDEFGAAVLEVDPGELAGLDPGDYAIHAVYSGDALHLASSAGSTLTVTERPAVVPLPATLPAASDGTLDGVPDDSDPGQRFEVEATGFAPFAPVTFGIYSTPQLLATVNADANGIAVATLEIPSELRGPHTVAAIGLGPSSDPLVLTAATTVRTPLFNLPALGTSATPPLLLLTLLSLGLGFVLLLARRLGLHAGRRT